MLSLDPFIHVVIFNVVILLLSRLSSLPLSSIKDIDDQADVIILRTDPLYKTAALVQSYTQHVLRPHVDPFMKISVFVIER